MRRAPDLRVAPASVTGRGEDPQESRLIVDNAVAHLAGVLVQLPGNWRAVPACSGHADHERLTACAHGDGQHGEQIPRALHVDSSNGQQLKFAPCLGSCLAETTWK